MTSLKDRFPKAIRQRPEYARYSNDQAEYDEQLAELATIIRDAELARSDTEALREAHREQARRVADLEFELERAIRRAVLVELDEESADSQPGGDRG